MKKLINITLWIVVNNVLLQSVRATKKNEINYDKKFGKIVHVTAFFRHGDRNPIVTYPRDPYRNFSWPPDGFGQLNHIGRKRAYKLGKWFRKRYDYLTNEISSHTNISMLSSYTDRTIMSAQCFLAAFYPPKINETIKKNLLWQPTPIRTLPYGHDRVINNNEKCPREDELIAKCYASKKMKNIFDKYARVMSYVGKHSGYKLSRNDVKTSRNISHLYHTFCIELEYGFQLPKWTKKIFPEPLSTIELDLSYRDAKVKKIQRLHSGPLLESIKLEMERKINGTSQTIFNLYSGHDTPLVYLMNTLGIYNNINPPYSAALIFELREKSRENNIITIFYANSTETSPHFLQMPNCKSPCTFRNFVRVIDRAIPSDWEVECQMNKNP